MVRIWFSDCRREHLEDFVNVRGQDGVASFGPIKE